MTDRRFIFRWDVDHRVCITDGLPKIRAVCRDFGVANTFFVNMGRSTNLREWLGKGVTRSRAKLADREAVHLIKKTGWPRFVLETALARPVGLNFVTVLQAMQREGHELGLHGGMDHVVWSRRFHELDEETLQTDVNESYAHFLRHLGRPAGFSSPGFYSDERVMRLLDRLGFLYNGDGIGGEPRRATATGQPLRHWTIPVTLSGPRTIPFLEYHGARGTPEADVLRQLDEHLEAHELVVLYGHPCYEGVHEALLRKIFAAVLERGFRFVTMHSVAEQLPVSGRRPMIRVMSVFGTRPEAIKMAPVVRALLAAPDRFESLVCVTAQHRTMLDQVLDVFGLQTDHDLDLMVPGQTPSGVAAGVLEQLPAVLRRVRPDVVLVQGDTMTTFAAGFAAYLEKIPSGHIEAGLRTGNRWRPFPEEMNRVLTARIAAIHFPPTAQARDALLAEGIPAEDVYLTGNTVIDALLQTVRPDYAFRTPALARLDPSRRLVLVTTHRRESFGAPMQSICAAVCDLGARFPDLQFVLPVHPNPQVKETVESLLSDLPGMFLIEPVDYVEFVHLMARSYMILTDSGGVQEEAPSLGKPVLVLREVTERPEGVAAGTAVVVGTDRERIVSVASELVTSDDAYRRMANAANPYGDGKASERILTTLSSRFG